MLLRVRNDESAVIESAGGSCCFKLDCNESPRSARTLALVNRRKNPRVAHFRYLEEKRFDRSTNFYGCLYRTMNETNRDGRKWRKGKKGARKRETPSVVRARIASLHRGSERVTDMHTCGSATAGRRRNERRRVRADARERERKRGRKSEKTRHFPASATKVLCNEWQRERPVTRADAEELSFAFAFK